MSVKKHLVGGAFSISLFFTNAAQAMKVSEYNALPSDTQREDFTFYLIKGAADKFAKEDNKEASDKVWALFSHKDSRGHTVGIDECMTMLNTATAALKKDPAKDFTVEDILFATLKKHGIDGITRKDLADIGSKYKPAP